MKISKFVLAAVALVGAAGAAHADQANARFNGSVANTCTLTVGAAGTMAPNVDSDQLSSANSGGAAATVSALTTARGYQLTALAPSSFVSAPATDAGPYTFTSAYSVSGPTSASNVPGATATTLGRGNNAVSVDLAVVKDSGGVFSNGSYAADVLVRCE